MKLILRFLIWVLIGFAGKPVFLFSIGEISLTKIPDKTEPCTIVIFGASGDLSHRKLFPAIYHLAKENHLSKNTAVIGFARDLSNDNTFRYQIGNSIERFSRSGERDEEVWDEIQKKIYYSAGNFDNDQSYEELSAILSKIEKEYETKSNRLYYLSVPPSYFSIIIRKLYDHGLIYDSKDTAKWSKVIIEKPFGQSLESALKLQRVISETLDDSQVFRMDHYLGKEGVQNLLTQRFESAFFEPLWNNKYIDNVQITLSEDIGIGTRAGFWESTGTLRDVFQNHLMQLLTLVAMERPISLDSLSIHEEKIKLLESIRPFPFAGINEYVICGQYGPGSIHGKEVIGYKQESGVSKDSTAETYIAAKLFIDNSRWCGVPFYLRAGKRLPKQITEIAITFKNWKESKNSNILFIRIQPNPAIFLKTISKVPALNKQIEPVIFGFSPESYFSRSSTEAYEKLLFDCINGDSSLYVYGEEQLAAWRLLNPILDFWNESKKEVNEYNAGTWGPLEADQLLFENGHQWQLLEN